MLQQKKTYQNYAKKIILAQAVDGIHPCVAVLGSHICKAVIGGKNYSKSHTQCNENNRNELIHM